MKTYEETIKSMAWDYRLWYGMHEDECKKRAEENLITKLDMIAFIFSCSRNKVIEDLVNLTSAQ